MKKVRLTRVEGRVTSAMIGGHRMVNGDMLAIVNFGRGLAIGKSIEGELDENSDESIVPRKPTVGRPFFISTYKTGLVEEVISDKLFRTDKSVYCLEYLS